MSPNVEQVKRSIEGLPAVERKELFDWFEENKPIVELTHPASEAILLERLLKEGFISEIARPMTDEEDDEFEPIKIGGEPLSHSILRERR